MLNIDKDSIKVYGQSIFPAIAFTITDSQLEDTIPIRIDGIVLSMDWRYIANITELPDAQVRNNTTVDGRMVTYASTVSDKVLEHIEHLRQQHKNKDIVLYLIFKVCYLKHSINLGNYAMKSIENDNNVIRILDNNPLECEDNNSNNTNPQILVKENKKNNDDGLIFYLVDQFRRQIMIPSNEWTNNFQARLGNPYYEY